MDEAATPSGQQGQRMLAAIVFTDVVGFSTLAGIDEAKAVRLLERDTKLIREISQQHGASLVKGTGDGMLICFTSAVGAVQAAMDIQEAIRKQNENLSSTEVLKHRMGVHLGDVILLPNDVIGDGVNVASRLQQEAKPGGIAISDAIYAVVRGKLPFKATNLGPRNLKHIVETVNVWMIPPLDDPAAPVQAIHPAALPGYNLEPQREQNQGGIRLAAIAFGIVLCLAAMAFIGKMVANTNANRQAMKPSANSPAARKQESISKGPASTGENVAANPSSETQTNKPATPDGEVSNANAAEPPPTDDVAGLISNYEFDTAADMLDRREDRARHSVRTARLRRLGEFRRWLESAISGATYARPIMVRGGGTSVDLDYELWTADGAMQVRLQDGSVKGATLRDMEPRELLRVTVAVFKRENASSNERANIGARGRDFAIEMKLGKLPEGFE